MTDEEVRRTSDLGEFLAVLPALKNFHADTVYDYGRDATPISHTYHSHNERPMSHDEIRAFLRKPGVLPPPVLQKLSERDGR